MKNPALFFWGLSFSIILLLVPKSASASRYTLPITDYSAITSWLDHTSPQYENDSSIYMTRYDGTTGYSYNGHNGIDYATGLEGKDVFASEDGAIRQLQWQNPNDHTDGYGYFVRIWHSQHGNSTLYAHLQENSQPSCLATGVDISKGQKIGLSGDTGNSSGPHLHFSIFNNDSSNTINSIDPYGWSGNGQPNLTTVDPNDVFAADPWAIDQGYLWTTNPPSAGPSVAECNRPPSIPNLLTPTNNSLLGSQTVNFVWSGSTDPDGDTGLDYSLVVINNTTGQTALETNWMDETEVFNNGVLSYAFSSLPDDFYRWYVKVRDPAPNFAENQSATQYFQVQSRYRAEVVSKSGDVSFGRNQSAQFEVQLRNTGTVTWERDHPSYPVRLGTSHDRNRTPVLYRHDAVGGNPSGWLSENRVTMVESSVSPGNIGTFRFWYSVPSWMNPGILQEHFELVADNANMGWFEVPDIAWNITILPDWDATYLSQTFSCAETRSLSKGGSLEYIVWLRNSGAQTWTKTGANPVRLGTSGPHDRITTLIREDYLNNNPSGWATDNRVEMVESSVPTGGTGTFRFWLSMPTWHPNAYRIEPFQLVVENIAWIGPEISWCQNLYGQPSDYHAQFISQNSYPTLSVGQGYNFQMTFRNTGTATWHPMVTHLGTSNPLDRLPGFTAGTGWYSNNRAVLPVTSVPPGSDATFNFQMTVPGGKPIGDYQEYFRPVADPITWMEDQGTHWWIYVR